MGKYKKELLFTLAVLAAAAGLWLATHAGRGTGNVAVVRYGDPQVEQRIDLSQNADYDIDTGTYTVHLHVENGGKRLRPPGQRCQEYYARCGVQFPHPGRRRSCLIFWPAPRRWWICRTPACR